MFSESRLLHLLQWKRVTGRLGAAALLCLLGATPFAAAPPPPPTLLVDELDEVVVSARKPLPLETYIEYPEYDYVAISPGGNRLAIGWTDEKYTRLLTVAEFPSMKKIDNQILQQHMGAADLRWASDRWLLVQPDYPMRGFRRTREPVGSLFAVDIERHQLQVLNKDPLNQAALFNSTLAGDPLSDQREEQERGDKARKKREARGARDPAAGDNPDKKAQGPLRWLAARSEQPEQALFLTTRNTSRDGSKTDGYGAFSLKLAGLKQERVATAPLPEARFITGPAGRIALAAGINDRNEEVVYYLSPDAREEGSDWQLCAGSRSGERGVRPVAWTGNGEEYYVLDGRGATRAVAVWDAASSKLRVLYRNPDADMDDYALDPAGRPWMFSGVDGVPVYWYPDPEHPLARLHQFLVKQLPQERVDITSASDDMALAVVRVSSGRRAPVYLVMKVDTRETMTGMQAYPKLKTKRLGVVEPVEFQARDGVWIQGYLTTPTDADGKPRRHVPMVVVAHDGPAGDPADVRYDYERQLFASRGYAVLQVNHRGSRGRGVAFERSGDGKWGREVQEDFADGALWAIRDGVAAKDRVCFYGTRYGAYSALMAAARDPDVFQCVIGAAGIYDLPDMLGNGKTPIAPALQQVFGSDMQKLKERSPISNAAAIKAKVLLIWQKNDEVVPKEQFTHMRLALQEAGNSPEADTVGDAVDGFFTTEGRVGVYARMLKFMEKTIGN